MAVTMHNIGGRTIFTEKAHAGDMIVGWSSHQKFRGNPLLWFSWERIGNFREWHACGVKTQREAIAAALKSPATV